MTLGQTLLLLYAAWFLAGWLAMRLVGEPMSEGGMLVVFGGPLVALLFIGLPPRPSHRVDDLPPSPRRMRK